jgi:hypothetical protein
MNLLAARHFVRVTALSLYENNKKSSRMQRKHMELYSGLIRLFLYIEIGIKKYYSS